MSTSPLQQWKNFKTLATKCTYRSSSDWSFQIWLTLSTLNLSDAKEFNYAGSKKHYANLCRQFKMVNHVNRKTHVRLVSPDERWCYIFWARKNYCEFLAHVNLLMKTICFQKISKIVFKTFQSVKWKARIFEKTLFY